VYEAANGGDFDPYPIVSPYSLPTSSQDVDGVNSPTVTNLIDATGYTTNPTALTGIWTRIYDTEDALAVNIPLLYRTSGTSACQRCMVSGQCPFPNFDEAWVS